MKRRWHTALAFAAAMAWLAGSAAARELDVGPSHVLRLPSQAATVAMAGDVVRIDPGVYADCGIWNAARLRIEATGPGVRLVGKSCAGKGIFVIQGNDVTIRGISFEGATVPEHNGAGIRGGGNNLTVENSRFIDNENGILAGGGPRSVLRVTGSTFIGNGACIGSCAHGIYAGQPMFLLDIEDCVFQNTRTAHHIKSRARTTLIRRTRIEDGAAGTSSYLIDIPWGGNVLIANNQMQKGPASENRNVAITIGEEGRINPGSAVYIQNNTFRNDTGHTTIFVRNAAVAPAMVRDNRLTGPVTPLSGPGEVVEP